MKGFGPLDYGVVLVYLVTIVVVGTSFYRRSTTPKEYFLSGRSMSWLPVGVSIIAADTSAISVMGNSAWAYKHNLELIWVSIGPLLVTPVVVGIFIPLYSRLDLYTAYEYLEKRFDISVRIVSSLLFHILRCVHIAIALYAPSLVVNLVTGIPTWQCILCLGTLTTLYTSFGGMKAVIWTDMIQFCTLAGGIVLAFVVAICRIDGGILGAYTAAREGGRLNVLNFSTDPTQTTSLWACLFGGAVLSLAPLATDQAILQRMFTTRSRRECTRSVLLNGILTIPMMALLFLVGSGLFAFYFQHPDRLAGLTSDDAILPFFAVHELPSGVSGLIIASILAASMAVMSAGINALATATTMDFYERIFHSSTTLQQSANFGRIATGLWGLTATVLALFVGRLGDLAVAYTRVSSLISGPMLGIFLLGAISKRPTTEGVWIGAVFGIVAVACVSVFLEWSFFYQAPIGLAITFIIGYLASCYVRRPPEEKVRGLVIG